MMEVERRKTIQLLISGHGHMLGTLGIGKQGEEAGPSQMFSEFRENSWLGAVLGRTVPSLSPSRQNSSGGRGAAKAVSSNPRYQKQEGMLLRLTSGLEVTTLPGCVKRPVRHVHVISGVGTILRDLLISRKTLVVNP